MSKFLQIHMLVAYPPSNLNRDDLGRPKTAVMGGVQRLRISSQSLKRAWRTSEVFNNELSGHIGVRTKEMGDKIFEAMVTGKSLYGLIYDTDNRTEVNAPISEKKAAKWTEDIAAMFGKLQSNKKTIEQLAHYSEAEIRAIDALIIKLANEDATLEKDDLKSLLRKDDAAADIAMFGRMLASSPLYNVEAAVQVAHAITVHKVAIEDDYFTAVDDLNRGEEDAGAGHLGQFEFSSGLYYLYLCINTDLLHDNVGSDAALAQKALRALVVAAACVPPKGKQNSFASRAYASYLLAEIGTQQPRSLAISYLKPVDDNDVLGKAIEELKRTRDSIDKIYGQSYDSKSEYDVKAGTGTLGDVLTFVESVYGGR